MKVGLATSVVALVFVAGCATTYPGPRFASAPGEDTTFTGLSSHLGSRPVDVVLVHGMCTHDAKWATDSVVRMYQALGGDPKIVNLTGREVAGTKIRLYQQTLATPKGNIRANAIVWSPLTEPFKKQLCYDMSERAGYCTTEDAPKPYPYDRALLNRKLKDEILNDCLADAMIYQGVSREEVNRQMQAVLVDALATSGASRAPATPDAMARAIADESPDLPLVVITDSLGSKVTFDALVRLTRRERDFRDAGQKTIDRLTHVFMKANQMPILALADQGIESPAGVTRAQSPFPADSLSVVVRSRAARGPGTKEKSGLPSVVAFTDPNDLLSYILAPSTHRKDYEYPVIDAVSSNAKTLLGVVELPTTAHLGYSANEWVYKLIACGNPDRCGR